MRNIRHLPQSYFAPLFSPNPFPKTKLKQNKKTGYASMDDNQTLLEADGFMSTKYHVPFAMCDKIGMSTV